MRRSSWLLLVAALAAAAPLHAAKKPDWVSGSSAKYPREAYLVGVGGADGRATAEDRARGEISKIFTTFVSVNTALEETETNLKDAKGEKSNFAQSVSQSVQTVSKKALEGVEVVENWQDEATREHFALAVLSRSKASSALEDKLAELHVQAKQYKDQLDSAPEKLQRVRAGMKLLTLLNARKSVVADLRVLQPGQKAAEPPFDEAAARAQAAKAVSELDVIVDIQ